VFERVSEVDFGELAALFLKNCRTNENCGQFSSLTNKCTKPYKMQGTSTTKCTAGNVLHVGHN